MERNIALKLMYNGTAYHGWQVQKNAVSVAETLEKALATVVCHPVKCTGAGRTDAHVHAETYVANFRTTSTIPCDRHPPGGEHPPAQGHRGGAGHRGPRGVQRHRLLPQEGVYLPHL